MTLVLSMIVHHLKWHATKSCVFWIVICVVEDVVATFESLTTTFLNDKLPLLSFYESDSQSAAEDFLLCFHITCVNVLDRAGTGSTRTNNALEPFLQLPAVLFCTHPTVWKLLESLEAQQKQTRSRLLRVSRGDTFKVSAVNRRRNERIRNFISDYTRAMDFPRGIGYNYLI